MLHTSPVKGFVIQRIEESSFPFTLNFGMVPFWNKNKYVFWKLNTRQSCYYINVINLYHYSEAKILKYKN